MGAAKPGDKHEPDGGEVEPDAVAAGAEDAEGRPPRNPAESALCQLFAKVLDVSSVTIDDDFFMLGGHSIQVMQLLEQIRDELGIEVKPRTFFVAPTVAGISQRLGITSR